MRFPDLLTQKLLIERWSNWTQNDFIEKAVVGPMKQVKEGDYDGLVKVMKFLKVGYNLSTIL